MKKRSTPKSEHKTGDDLSSLRSLRPDYTILKTLEPLTSLTKRGDVVIPKSLDDGLIYKSMLISLKPELDKRLIAMAEKQGVIPHDLMDYLLAYALDQVDKGALDVSRLAPRKGKRHTGRQTKS